MSNIIQLSKGYSRYGAQMGRQDGSVSGKCKLQKVRMSSCGAYDWAGAYWGIGEPLYVCEDKDGNQMFVRALTRDEAKGILRAYSKPLTFYK